MEAYAKSADAKYFQALIHEYETLSFPPYLLVSCKHASVFVPVLVDTNRLVIVVPFSREVLCCSLGTFSLVQKTDYPGSLDN